MKRLLFFLMISFLTMMSASLHAGPKNCSGLICNAGSSPQSGIVAPVVGAPISISKPGLQPSIRMPQLAGISGAGGDLDDDDPLATYSPDVFKATMSRLSDMGMIGSRAVDQVALTPELAKVYLMLDPNLYDDAEVLVNLYTNPTGWEPGAENYLFLKAYRLPLTGGGVTIGPGYVGVTIHTHPSAPIPDSGIFFPEKQVLNFSPLDLESFYRNRDTRFMGVKTAFGGFFLAKPYVERGHISKAESYLAINRYSWNSFAQSFAMSEADAVKTFGNPERFTALNLERMTTNDYSAWARKSFVLQRDFLVKYASEMNYNLWYAPVDSATFIPLHIAYGE